MRNQKEYWDKRHSDGSFDFYSNEASSFAKKLLITLKTPSKILDLGCGTGVDSNYFATKGYLVTATDFSHSAIEKNKKYYSTPGLRFEILDMENKFPYKDSMFDTVYSRLSLHYFSDKKTKEIVSEIFRILKPEGTFAFVVKSTKDPLYGKGVKIEENMYDNNGHIRHFFTEDYAKEILKNNFTIETMESGEEKFYSDNSAFVKVIAKKLKP